jgi:hypothetical protein
MQISADDKKKVSQSLMNLIDNASRTLVSLRKKDNEGIIDNLDKLGLTITEFLIDTGSEIFPVDWETHQAEKR